MFADAGISIFISNTVRKNFWHIENKNNINDKAHIINQNNVDAAKINLQLVITIIEQMSELTGLIIFPPPIAVQNTKLKIGKYTL